MPDPEPRVGIRQGTGGRIAAGFGAAIVVVISIGAMGLQLKAPTPYSAPTASPVSLGSHAGMAALTAFESHQSNKTTRSRSATPPTNWTEIIALGTGAIGCAALARRSRRTHLRSLEADGGDDPLLDFPEETIDTSLVLARHGELPALRVFELANCELDRALRRSGGELRSTRIRAVCASPAGVHFWLAEPAPAAPAGFTLVAEGQAWHVARQVLPKAETTRPHFPIVLAVGDDEEGTWLVPLEAGTCLPILGDAADALWRNACEVQEAWPWSDRVLITDDPAAVTDEFRRRRETGAITPVRSRILYFGDPGSLHPAIHQMVSIVTSAVTPSSDVTIFADRQAATLHPLGRTLRPHRLAQKPVDGRRDPGPEPCREPEAPAEPHHQLTPPTAQSFMQVGYPQSPGTVELKLLTMTPRLEGMCQPLPPNRSRRAVELVAYLALHRPDVVTSDRLRTRVLGTSDADAASKTLFNVATAARRSLGTDTEGNLLLPPGNRGGHYALSNAVTVDAQRAAGLASIGSGKVDAQEAMAYLRAALTLVEGEPLANALSGYTWWESEGHGARIAAVLVNAACNLAALAVSSGAFELAQWGLGQARLVEPYSEALTRAAMQVAAAAGDADRLRREWRECQQRMEELDPGSSPSPRTERLYDELADGVLVSTNGRFTG
jgi:DNA-binding SARP family transcriptional activator